MWSKTYSRTVEDLEESDVWEVWADVDRWAEWQDDVDLARLQGPFAKGSTFQLKPKGGPLVAIEILRCEAPGVFVDLTRFPLARMTGAHYMIENAGELELRTTISIEGPLAFLWRRIVAQGVADSLPAQTEALIKRARALKLAKAPSR
jgi:hypothetical protein